MNEDELKATEERWLNALAAYEKLAMGRRKVELNSIIRPILEQLQAEQSREALHARYNGADEWWLQIARNGYPDQPRLWEKQRTADVAFGMRLTQLLRSS